MKGKIVFYRKNGGESPAIITREYKSIDGKKVYDLVVFSPDTYPACYGIKGVEKSLINFVLDKK